MVVSSGFFNSVDHDRTYDAEEISSMFDGIILDGVYQGYGEVFNVKPGSLPNTVVVESGRAWFDHTWTLNDNDFAIELPGSNIMLPRYDTILIEVNLTNRKNRINYFTGTPSSNPQKVAPDNTDKIKYYPIAYILRPAESTMVTTSDIYTNIGGPRCPIVTGVLEVMSSDRFLEHMDEEFDVFLQENREEFATWFQGIKDLAGEEPVLELANRIEIIDEKVQATIDKVDEVNVKINEINALSDYYEKIAQLQKDVIDNSFTILRPRRIVALAGSSTSAAVWSWTVPFFYKGVKYSFGVKGTGSALVAMQNKFDVVTYIAGTYTGTFAPNTNDVNLTLQHPLIYSCSFDDGTINFYMLAKAYTGNGTYKMSMTVQDNTITQAKIETGTDARLANVNYSYVTESYPVFQLNPNETCFDDSLENISCYKSYYATGGIVYVLSMSTTGVYTFDTFSSDKTLYWKEWQGTIVPMYTVQTRNTVHLISVKNSVMNDNTNKITYRDIFHISIELTTNTIENETIQYKIADYNGDSPYSYNMLLLFPLIGDPTKFIVTSAYSSTNSYSYDSKNYKYMSINDDNSITFEPLDLLDYRLTNGNDQGRLYMYLLSKNENIQIYADDNKKTDPELYISSSKRTHGFEICVGKSKEIYKFLSSSSLRVDQSQYGIYCPYFQYIITTAPNSDLSKDPNYYQHTHDGFGTSQMNNSTNNATSLGTLTFNNSSYNLFSLVRNYDV